MTTTFAVRDAARPAPPSEYEPGVCNIGPAEIRRRRIVGHVGVAATLALLAVLVVFDSPTEARLLVIVPASLGASGYLQAWLKFCAAFGQRGIVNFGSRGHAEAVPDARARSADRRRARQVGLSSLAIGVAAGIVAMLLPI